MHPAILQVERGDSMREQKASIKFIETCYKLYEQKMYQTAYKILLDSSLAEDAVQEAFLKLMKSQIYFDDPESDDCKRYMITVIRHSSIDLYNKKKRDQNIIYMPANDDVLKNASAPDDTVADADLEDFIAGLPLKYYEVVNCLAVKNLSVKETASKLGITEAAVRKRFERAKRRLKSMQKGGEKHEAAGKPYRSRVL